MNLDELTIGEAKELAETNKHLSRGYKTKTM